MTTKKKSSVEDTAKKIARKSGKNVDDVRNAIIDAIRTRNLNKGDGYLSFAGILPLDLPDGTRIAVLPDIHVPAHDKLVMWAVRAFLKDYQPHILIFIGDVADVFALSRWARPPRVSADQQSELDETRRLVDQLMKISGCYHVFYIMGNHEDRIFRFLTDPAGGAANILDFQTREPVLSFHGLMGYKPGDPVTFIYDLGERSGYGGGLIINGDMELHHGYIVRPRPGASPLADADRTGRSIIHGHTHRAGMRARLTDSGMIRAIELGHLVDPTHPYLAYANLLNNWHPAVGAGLIHGGKLHLEALPIKQINYNGRPKYALAYNGKVYRASDR